MTAPRQAILALDVGEARIGLARWTSERDIQDEGSIRRTSLAEDYRRLARIIAERGVGQIVVGLPLNDDGSAGPQAKRARRFAAGLSRMLAQAAAPGEVVVTVGLWNEAETTIEATLELGLSGRPLAYRERGLVDSRSAAIILRRYIAGNASSGVRLNS